MSSNIIIQYDGNALVPAPIITINKEFIYSNDSIIGYTYVINLNGFACSNNTTIDSTLSKIKDVQSYLHRNGKRLIVSCNGKPVIDAHGGQLRSFEIEPTENKWINYAKYSASLEFSNVYFDPVDTDDPVAISNYLANGIPANNTEINSDSLTAGSFSDELLSIKSYSDNWNFNIDEEGMYSYYSRITEQDLLATEDYTRINVEYTITANGKHFFDVNGNLIPAWERAKNFVQQKLYTQINTFRTNGPLAIGIFSNTNYDGTDTTQSKLSDSHLSPQSTFSTILPILHGSIGTQYKVYNEVINCSTSESNGSFTATYKCILKRYVNPSIFPQHSIHNWTVSYEQTRDFNNNERTINVNGTVQGLLPTNILASTINGGSPVQPINGEIFSLPNNGPFVDTFTTTNVSKYQYALNDFITYIGKPASYDVNSVDDLRDNFKRVLSINLATLFPDTNPLALSNCTEGDVYLSSILALPQSFTVSHNYSEGSITYTAQYNTERSCAMERGYESFTVTENDSVPIYSEFIIPGRSGGPILQHLQTNKAKTITFDFQGTTKKGCVAGTPFSVDYSGVFSDVCYTENYINIPNKIKCMIAQTEANNPQLIIQSHNLSYNPTNGDYKFTKTYLVCPTGINSYSCT